MSESKSSRVERDSMGELEVPADRLYGASTRRAQLNFPISSLRLPRAFLRALGLIKHAAARANESLGKLESNLAVAIAEAAREVASGEFDEDFVVDVFQTGSGTSTNMNANEVIANVACRKLGGRVGERELVHPNDHVNLGQSSNDVFPSAIHVAAVEQGATLLEELRRLEEALGAKASEFDDVVKLGRTHLQDAVPMTLGQEFRGFRGQVASCQRRLDVALERLLELPIGGTAIGTGLNTDPVFPRRVAQILTDATGHAFHETSNHFELHAARDSCVELSGSLRVLAVALSKIAEDIAWLGSGPRGGLGELKLPEVQPGSSIMPGKVNPVICEMVLQVAARVIGLDSGTTMAAQGGRFQLNLRMPLIAHQLLESIEILTNAARVFRERCIEGLDADRDRCESFARRSLSLVTALVPEIGYDAAAQIAKEAYSSDRAILEVAEEMTDLESDRLRELLDPRKMVSNAPDDDPELLAPK